MSNNDISTKIEEIRQQIEDLKARWPAHSVPPALMAQLDDLEEQLSDLLKEQAVENRRH